MGGRVGEAGGARKGRERAALGVMVRMGIVRTALIGEKVLRGWVKVGEIV